ncbi:MAG: 1,6-anhydro-N-acetylmuramyl-L-alanine amidase AmpD [Pseudomonadales bacterium]|nr:1,6-anhydro-N-acetylmuramyl-L-alanine amidase AmpD [Pseudomonadales bacterium]
MNIVDDRLAEAHQVESPNFDDRPDNGIDLIVVHNISLPAGHFGTRYVEQLFLNCLATNDHPDFQDLSELRVSSHLLIRRNGDIIQFVPFDKRAWHAGESNYKGRDRCNDFSIGIELEGTDDSGYCDVQYRRLAEVCAALSDEYGIGAGDIVGHCDIAPGRKTDPGQGFDWQRFRNLMGNNG